ncbi:hypothetical protein LCGC14_0974710 [marine sediment metagenome]|uniref:Terminase small subunit n=1 Tax=marine sediment metagenome TaxID=412755 RepID=A0A0F9QTU7_9ZZZZ
MGKKTDRNEKGQFTIGNPGREKIFTTPKELEEYIKEYFDECDNNPFKKTEFHGKDAEECIVPIPRPYTIEGLSVHLEITRQALLNYEKAKGYEPYFNVVTHAKDFIKQRLVEAAVAGITKESFSKFLLINSSDYADKSEVDHRSGDRSMQPMNIIVDSKDTGDEFEKLIDGAKNNERPSEE